MNKESAKDFLPLVQALTDGKIIQVNTGTIEEPFWVDTSEPHFGSDACFYRIKPEPKPPKWREWDVDDVPLGCLITHDNWTGRMRAKFMICGADKDGVCWCVPDAERPVGIQTFSHLLDRGFKHSTDGGKTWHPCGVLEVEE